MMTVIGRYMRTIAGEYFEAIPDEFGAKLAKDLLAPPRTYIKNQDGQKFRKDS